MATANQIEEEYYTKFNVVLSYIFSQKIKGNLLPNFMQMKEFTEAKTEAFYYHSLGLIGEFYNRIQRNSL